MSPTDDASDQPMKRAPVVYGKRSNNHAPSSSVDPADDQDQDRVCHARSSPPSVHASDSERSRSPDAVDSFQFGFRHRLKELDEQFGDHDAQSSKPGLFPDNPAVHAGVSQPEDLQGVSMGTTILSSEVTCASSPSLTSSQSTSAQVHPLKSPPVRRYTRRVSSPVPFHSEAEQLSESSSVSPVRHPITTPHSRSSPTPPTSGEFPMVSRKAKGKAPARDVLPLLFDGERPSAAEIPIKSKKGRRSEPLLRPKTKAPTKKERREAALESSRIAAGRPVEVTRTQEQKHSLAAFFASLRRDNIITPTLGTELPSDPIERFSSPTDRSTRVQPSSKLFGAPTGLESSVHAGTTNQPSLSGDTKTLPLAATDSDDEMPSVVSIIQRANGKQERLQAIKRVALQHANTSAAVDNDSEDDDLLIVKDDMHSVAREEAAQRRLDKAHGSPAKDRILPRGINRPGARPTVISPRKFSKQELQELAKPSFARRNTKGQLSKGRLDQLMIMQHTEEQLKSIKRQEEEWLKRGGRLSRDTGGDETHASLPQRLEAYAAQGLRAMEIGDTVGDEASTDESDKDYSPSLQSSPGPQPAEESDMPGNNLEVSRFPQPPGHRDEDEEDEEEVVALRRNKSGQRRPHAVVGSDDEGVQLVQRTLHTAQRDTASSMESQTEDENDKENSAKLMYDRSEDKENKAVVRHELSPSELGSGSRLGSLHDIGEGAQRSLSLASATNFNGTTCSPNGDARSPLKDISKDEDDFSLSPPSKSSFADRLLQSAAVSPPRTSVSTLSLGSSPISRSERISRIDRHSLGKDESFGFKALQSSFLERPHSPKSSLAVLNPLSNGGFSQLFSAEDRNFKKPIDRAESDGLSLTLDVGLKPALEVSNSLRQKAEVIFEKEQEYVVTAAVKLDGRPKEPLYVNDHGFLTQTRPEGSSPQIYRMTPSQASKLNGTQVYPTQTQSLSTRLPLRTLSFTASRELSPEPQPLRRLRKRSPSPLEQKVLGQNGNPATKLNAFSILGKVPKPSPMAQNKKYDKSEFVAVEAEESDEDDMFGFGGGKKDDDEEQDKEQDKDVEGLVDDTFMDAEAEAAELVQEKYREHEGEDDQRLQKLHQDAVDGKFRVKRRDRGVGFEDDSDDDDDDERRIRQRMYKKRKIEGDNLEALGLNEETKAFYNTYHQDLVDQDDEFGYLRENGLVAPDNGDTQAEESEEQETVSMDEIRQRVREMAQSNNEVDMLDLNDTSWVDQSMITEADDTVRVKVVDCRRSKPVVRHSNASHIDFDEERPARHAESEQERKQMASWAKNQNRGRQGTGRSGNTAAVTGHAKAKSGGGSLRSTQPLNLATVSTARKGKTSSLLSTVSNRNGKFA